MIQELTEHQMDVLKEVLELRIAAGVDSIPELEVLSLVDSSCIDQRLNALANQVDTQCKEYDL